MSVSGDRLSLVKVNSYSSRDGDQSPVGAGEDVASIRLDDLSGKTSPGSGPKRRNVTDLTSFQARLRASLAEPAGNADEAEESETDPLMPAGDASDAVDESEPVKLTEAEENEKLSKEEEDDLAKYRDRYANWGSVWGATIGAAIGAVGGSFIPGLGTVAGAGAGAALGLAIGRAVGWIVGNVKGKRAILNSRLEAKEKRLLEEQQQLPKARRGAKALREGVSVRNARRVSVPLRGAGNLTSLVSKRRRQTYAPEVQAGRPPRVRRQSSHGASAMGAYGVMLALDPNN